MTKILTASVLLISACYSQSTPRLEFEAASIKLSSPPFKLMYCRGGPESDDPGYFRCKNAGLGNLIVWAYALGPNQLSTPDRPGDTGFDVDVKVPRDTTKSQFRVMLQNLLADRFKLVTHRETRETSAYRLTVAQGGPKFKPAASKEAPDATDSALQPPAARSPSFDDAGYPIFAFGESGTSSKFDGHTTMYQPRMTMPWLATMLSDYIHAPVTMKPASMANTKSGFTGFSIPRWQPRPATTFRARRSSKRFRKNWDCAWTRLRTGPLRSSWLTTQKSFLPRTNSTPQNLGDRPSVELP